MRFVHWSASGDPSPEGDSVRQRLAESGLGDVGELETISGDDIAEAVLARAQSHDLILLETTSAPVATHGLRGATAERIAERAACSTLLVRAAPRS